jgi:hypothetical protein
VSIFLKVRVLNSQRQRNLVFLFDMLNSESWKLPLLKTSKVTVSIKNKMSQAGLFRIINFIYLIYTFLELSLNAIADYLLLSTRCIRLLFSAFIGRLFDIRCSV